MFDDIPNNSVKGSIPSNLPIDEPEDMFSAVDSVESVSDNSALEDSQDRSPLATASAVSAGILKPKAVPTQKPQSYDDHLDTLVAPEMAKESAPHGSRIIFIVIALVVVLGIFSAIGYGVYSFFFSQKNNEVVPGIIVPTSTADTVNDSSSITADQVVEEESDREVLFGGQIDTDGDGIDDSIEQTIGTDPQVADTDKDELSDGDEILIWKTNPLNPDTDGDGYLDGVEVRSGYSPLGSGKLFISNTSTIPSNEISTSTSST